MHRNSIMHIVKRGTTMRLRELKLKDFATVRRGSFIDDIDLFEMVNLASTDTGVEGAIYISTKQGKHGARVKWYPQPPKDAASPCLAVSISANPVARNLNLPDRIASRASDIVKAWVALNHVELLDFWNNGIRWSRQQVSAFPDTLRKLP